MQGTPTIMNRKTAVRPIKDMPASKLPYVINTLRNVRSYEETEPDEWDRALLNEAADENDGSVISLEQLAEDLGVAL